MEPERGPFQRMFHVCFWALAQAEGALPLFDVVSGHVYNRSCFVGGGGGAGLTSIVLP